MTDTEALQFLDSKNGWIHLNQAAEIFDGTAPGGATAFGRVPYAAFLHLKNGSLIAPVGEQSSSAQQYKITDSGRDLLRTLLSNESGT